MSQRHRTPPNEGMSTWQFNWRGYFVYRVHARTEEEARQIALANRPPHVPEGTELMHYGRVQS